MIHVVKCNRTQDARAVQVWLRDRKMRYNLQFEPDEKMCYLITFQIKTGELFQETMDEGTLYDALVAYLKTWDHIQKAGLRDISLNGIPLQ